MLPPCPTESNIAIKFSMGELKRRVIKGAFWVLIERFSIQMVTFVIGVILARLLSPTDYGTVALLSIFTSIASVLADSGFGSALIQKKNVTELEFNSVFYLSLAVTTILYVILFLLAPTVARFYKIPELCLILRILSAMLFFNAVNSIQNAELNRKLLFHLSFRISLMSTITSAIVGFLLAFLGYGVWALVWSNIASGIVGMISRWCIIAWRPRLMFSLSALKPLFRYGWKLSLSTLIWTISNNLYGLVIGKFYSRADLSFVNKGSHLPQIVMQNVNGALARVAFPALAKMQDERIKMRETMRRMMVVSTFFVFPLMMVFAVTARGIIFFLFGQKWLPAVPYAMIACFTFALAPFASINNYGIQAMGRSEVVLKITIINRIVGLTILVAFLSKGVLEWCLAAAFLSSPFSVIVNSWPNRKLLNYTLKMQVLDVLPTILGCAVVFFPIAAINLIPTSSQLARFGVITAQWILAFLLYFGFAWLFRLQGLCEVCHIVKSRIISKMPFLEPLFAHLENK